MVKQDNRRELSAKVCYKKFHKESLIFLNILINMILWFVTLMPCTMISLGWAIRTRRCWPKTVPCWQARTRKCHASGFNLRLYVITSIVIWLHINLYGNYIIVAQKVLMRVEQEQKVTEDARRYAEQDAAAQRYATEVLQVNF